jgi:hypothetical protein
MRLQSVLCVFQFVVACCSLLNFAFILSLILFFIMLIKSVFNYIKCLIDCLVPCSFRVMFVRTKSTY